METVLIAVLIGVLAYVLLHAARVREPSRYPAPPERKASRTIRVFERRPSGGLAWSRAQYPEQYVAANMRTTRLAGIEDFENERFLDIGGRAYSRAVLKDFSYTDPKAKRPRVAVEYLAKAETFAGTLRARGLKPNFAYQIKLRGRYWDDPEGFERIGRVGRWRLPGRGTNYTDEAYEAYERKEDVEAYLLFDFFVTDDEGNAEKEFYADSSLHVLWNASTQRGPSRWDGTQRAVDRAGSRRDYYAHPRANFDVQRLYAESEQHSRNRGNRRPIGEAFMPPGRYRAEVVLTEESFHGYGDAGFWATVMYGVVEFEVEDKRCPSGQHDTGRLVGGETSLRNVTLKNIEVERHEEGVIEGTARNGDPRIVFDGIFEFAAGERHALALEVKARRSHTWDIYLDLGNGFERRPTMSLSSRGRGGWQRFEVELTSLVAGRRVRMRIDPSRREGEMGIRRVGLYRIVEETGRVVAGER